jgi:hypothetical protein
MLLRTRISRVWNFLPIPVRLVAGLALLVTSGTLLLLVTEWVSDRPLLWNEALFTTVSALTVTGLSVIAPGRDLTGAGQFVLLILIQLGGVGFMALAVVLFQLLGWQVRLENRAQEKYGRLLADVYVGDIHINQWLLDKGYAKAYTGWTKEVFHPSTSAVKKRLEGVNVE